MTTYFSVFTFLRQDLPLAWNSPSRRSFLVSKPCGLCVSDPAMFGLSVGHHTWVYGLSVSDPIVLGLLNVGHHT